MSLLQCAHSFPVSCEALWAGGNREAVLTFWTIEWWVCMVLSAELTVILGSASSWHLTQGIFPGGLRSAMPASKAGPFAHFSGSSSLYCVFHQFRSIWTRIRLLTCYFKNVLLTESLVKGFGWSCRGPLGACEVSLQLSRISLKTCSFV